MFDSVNATCRSAAIPNCQYAIPEDHSRPPGNLWSSSGPLLNSASSAGLLGDVIAIDKDPRFFFR